MSISNSPKDALPAYIDFIYGHIYKFPEKCASLDNDISCGLRTFFQYKKLVRSLTKEIQMSQSVMQFGLTFGSQIDEVAMAVGAYGQYDIIDINSSEVTRANEKYWKVYQGMKIFKQDAANIKPKANYDVLICFMLLSQVPSQTKHKIVNNALKMVRPGGKVVFIDWHNPLSWHPLKYLTRMHNRLFHPFVERLWDREINTYAETEIRNRFIWRKSTYFGRMFQKIVATRKETPKEQYDRENLLAPQTSGLADF